MLNKCTKINQTFIIMELIVDEKSLLINFETKYWASKHIIIRNASDFLQNFLGTRKE